LILSQRPEKKNSAINGKTNLRIMQAGRSKGHYPHDVKIIPNILNQQKVNDIGWKILLKNESYKK